MFSFFTFTNILTAQWIKTNGPEVDYIQSFAVIDSNLFLGTIYAGAFLSTNNGTSWTAIDSGLTSKNVNSLVVTGTNLFAGTGGEEFDGNVFLTTNNGISWTAVNSGLPTNMIVFCLAVSGTNLFSGTNTGVFLSTNNGASWTAVDSGFPRTQINAFAVSGTNLFAATLSHGVFLSTNNGTSWTAVNSGLTYTDVVAFAVSGTNLFAGTASHGVFLSTNNGTSWTDINSGLINKHVTSFAVDGTNLFVGIQGSGVFLSTNNGTNWTAINSGLTNLAVRSLTIIGPFLYAGTDVRPALWRRLLSDIKTTVKESSTNRLPTRLILSQNYPNPFNPSTTISFSLPSKSFVILKILDILGREVSTLVNEELPAGNHSWQWNATNTSSGIYFYRLQTGLFTETKKIILLR